MKVASPCPATHAASPFSLDIYEPSAVYGQNNLGFLGANFRERAPFVGRFVPVNLAGADDSVRGRMIGRVESNNHFNERHE